MLSLIDDRNVIKSAQDRLSAALKEALPQIENCKVGFQGDSFDVAVQTLGNGSLYYAAKSPQIYSRSFGGALRYWNAFGIFRKGISNQNILVEINIPEEGDNAQVSGFFARDTSSGDIYLMHTGKIGGGRKGIGKNAFLNFLSDPLQQVNCAGRRRFGLIIGNIADPGLVTLIGRFAEKVSQFKVYANDPDMQNNSLILEETYTSEYSGRKLGLRKGHFDYYTYHGLVVDKLREVRALTLSKGEQISRTPLIDLFVRRGDCYSEVYEVKTSLDRQSFYTAVGQLMTHAVNDDTVRTLVIPEGELPSDCEDALQRLNIGVRRFKLMGRAANVKVELVKM